MQSLSFILATGLALASASARAQDTGAPPATAPVPPSPDAPVDAATPREAGAAAPNAGAPPDAAVTKETPRESLITELARSVLERGTQARAWQSVVAISVVDNAIAEARFGHLDGTEGPAAGAATRFQLGGVTAAYTGILLADLAVSRKVKLADPISAFLPAGATCADERVCAITLAELAGGASGLPALPANLFPRDSRDVLRDYGEPELLQFLATYRPTRWPAASGDSLLADGLLGWALGRAHGGGYAAALRERVLVPLQLGATEIDDAGLAPGYAGSVAVGAVHYGVLAGAGALRSTASDQVALLKAMLRPNESPLRNALLLARQSHGSDLRALGWRIDVAATDGRSWPIVWQRGASGGHASFIGVRADRQQALVLLGNNGVDLSQLGLAMLRGEGISAAPMIGPDAAPATTAVADDYAGLYAFAPGNEVVVRARNGALTAQVAGQLAVRLAAVGEDAYATPDAAIQVQFVRGEQRRIMALRWTERGINVPAARLSARAPHIERVAMPIGAAQLAEQCGDYAADASLVARLTCVGGAVYFQLTGSAERAMIPYAPDRFATADGEIELRITRGADGKPAALVLNLLGKELELPRVGTAPAEPAADALPAAKPASGSKPAAILRR